MQIGEQTMNKVDEEEVRLGIYLKRNNFKMVEIEKSSSGQFRINSLIQVNLDTSLDLNSIQNDSQVTEIGDQISEIFNVFKAEPKQAIFTLENPFALVKIIPVDSNLSKDELIDQVNWEVKQFSYSPDDEYIVDFQQLDSSNGKTTEEIIIVSVRQKIIQQLKKLFSAAKISVRVIELELFAAIRAVENNYDLKAGELVCLIEIDFQGIQFTILKDKKFYFSQDIPLSKLGIEGDSFKSIDDNEMAKIIYRELKRIIQDHQLGDSVEGFSRIFLYGDNVRDGALEKFQNSFNVRIDKTNPFRNVFIGPNVNVDEKISSHPETFTVCVGSAIR